ncbi:hypothetical protein SAMN05216251_124136 [Actinacidiphila alni]|uniref:Lipoprotein n=1 Tax=Actinacidiphila alni TaxID=380248 RepID=A0A1I2KXD9_9ACTN|nr:hypothetical protein [Actinacidiphila alni]SFF69566.1 hypothetical protein SAMN05216251_124136 [Actinacidiphila alni]
MTRSSLPIAVALAAAAGLLLTACGGGGSDSSDKIQPSQTATTSAAPVTTTPSPTQAAGPGAPKFDLPSDIKVDFKGFDDSDPTKKAALQDATYAAQSVLELEAKAHSKVTPNFSRFWTGGTGAAFADSLMSQITGKGGITGTYHYYNPVVKTLTDSGNLSVVYCEDQRKAYSKDSATGKVKTTTPSPSDFRQWNLQMTKSASGEWHVFDHKWLKGAKQCQVA